MAHSDLEQILTRLDRSDDRAEKRHEELVEKIHAQEIRLAGVEADLGRQKWWTRGAIGVAFTVVGGWITAKLTGN